MSDLVGNEDLEQMVANFIKLLNLLDVSANYGFLLFKDSDRAKNSHVHKLPIQTKTLIVS